MHTIGKAVGVLAGWVAAIGLTAGIAFGAESLEGTLNTAGVTGGSAKPHRWIEERIFACPVKPGAGTGVVSNHTPPGKFVIPGAPLPNGWAPGEYNLFALKYDAPLPFAFKTGIRVPEGAAKVEGLELQTPAHYSVMYDTDWKEWGETPWAQGADFYQTFVATSPYITRVATKLADKSGDHHHMTLDYAIYETNDGPPSTWKQISPVRNRFLSRGTDPIIHIFWVPYRSNEVKLVPGNTYAVRFWRDPASQSERFALVVRKDNGDGYKGGHLYAGDTPHKDLDAYALVSGGEAGTVVDHAPVGDLDFKNLIGSGQRFGQTFKAGGKSLAGVDVVYTTGQPQTPLQEIKFQLFDKPGGKPIGPARSCFGVAGAFQARAAVMWKRGEVPLKPGKMYYLEWTSPGCNTWKVNEDLPGEAYVNGQEKAGADLAMSIAEYVGAVTTKSEE